MNSSVFHFDIEFFEFKNNKTLNTLIEKIESIYINIIILYEYLPKIIFIVDFCNINLKNKNIFNKISKTRSLNLLVNKIYKTQISNVNNVIIIYVLNVI